VNADSITIQRVALLDEDVPNILQVTDLVDAVSLAKRDVVDSLSVISTTSPNTSSVDMNSQKIIGIGNAIDPTDVPSKLQTETYTND